jgi:hypothetical protein
VESRIEGLATGDFVFNTNGWAEYGLMGEGVPLCANDDETPAPFEFSLGHRRMTSWLCPTQMAQSK